MKKFSLILFIVSFFSISLYSQNNNYYECSSCSNPLFLKSEIIKEKKKNYITKFNKETNPAREKNERKDVHCSHCDSHTGYAEKDGEIKILSGSVHQENESYKCTVCKKPILSSKDLKEKFEDVYVFKFINNSDITVVNRSYILSGKKIYCGFCYQHLGKKYKKENLSLIKVKVILPN